MAFTIFPPLPGFPSMTSGIAGEGMKKYVPYPKPMFPLMNIEVPESFPPPPFGFTRMLNEEQGNNNAFIIMAKYFNGETNEDECKNALTQLMVGILAYKKETDMDEYNQSVESSKLLARDIDVKKDDMYSIAEKYVKALILTFNNMSLEKITIFKKTYNMLAEGKSMITGVDIPMIKF